MLDKNGLDIRTGDIVRISNTYFKNDNGLYYVEYSPGDASWNGDNHSLHKIKRNGQLSTAKYSTAFWPLCAFTNDRMKNAMAYEWNHEHATIEVVTGIDTSYIADHFKELAVSHAESSKQYGYRWGENSEWAVRYMEISEHYQSVANRISA